MQSRNRSNSTSNFQSKGPSHGIYVNGTFMGFVNIHEKNMPTATVDALKDPANLKAVLSQAEFRFSDPDRAPTNMSAVDQIIAEAKEASSTETA